MYSELTQNDRFVWFIKNDPANSIARVDKLLAHFHIGGKCNWRAKSLRNIILLSEIGMLLAIDIEKKMRELDEQDRTSLTEEIMDLHKFCIVQLSEMGDDPKRIGYWKSELVYAFLDNAQSIKKNDNSDWYFNNPDSVLVQSIRRNFSLNYPPSTIGAMEYNNICWNVVNIKHLYSRLSKHGTYMEPNTILDAREMARVILFGLNILGGRLSETLFATERHPLTNINGMISKADEIIGQLKNGQAPIGFITDGKNVSILVQGFNRKLDVSHEYWTCDKVDHRHYRIFLFKGSKKKYPEYTPLVGNMDRDKRKELLNKYKSFVATKQVELETC
jgi:hypothetical protein